MLCCSYLGVRTTSANLIRFFYFRIRHFPIELTPSGRYVIGKHAFDGLTEIVTFYKHNALFFTQNKEPVSLGDSFRGM